METRVAVCGNSSSLLIKFRLALIYALAHRGQGVFTRLWKGAITPVSLRTLFFTLNRWQSLAFTRKSSTPPPPPPRAASASVETPTAPPAPLFSSRSISGTDNERKCCWNVGFTEPTGPFTKGQDGFFFPI